MGPKTRKATDEPPKAQYAVGDSVVCFDGGARGTQRHHEAKVKKMRQRTDATPGHEYFVHWQGWADKWDEWMKDDDVRLMPFSEENQAKVKDDRSKATKKGRKSATGSRASTPNTAAAGGRSHSSADSESGQSERSSATSSKRPQSGSKATGGGSTTPSVKATARGDQGPALPQAAKASLPPPAAAAAAAAADNKSSTGSATKKRRTSAVGRAAQSAAGSAGERESGGAARRTEIKVPLPEPLKRVLVDDAALICGNNGQKIHKQPARHSVRRILDDYRTARSENPTLVECANGIQLFFDVSLGSVLLYKLERPQYKDAVEAHVSAGGDSDEFPAADNYGYVHLLRLFVKFGNMLACTGWPKENIDTVLSGVSDVVKFLDEKKSTYYNPETDYINTTTAYQKRVYE